VILYELEMKGEKEVKTKLCRTLCQALGLLLRQTQIRFVLTFLELRPETGKSKSKSKKKTVEEEYGLTKYQIKNLCKVSRGIIQSVIRDHQIKTLLQKSPGTECVLQMLLSAQNSETGEAEWGVATCASPLATFEALLDFTDEIELVVPPARSLLLEGLRHLPCENMSAWSTAIKTISRFELASPAQKKTSLLEPSEILPKLMAKMPDSKVGM
jgi:hypothetical protein